MSLLSERNQATFPQEQLSYILYGSKDVYQRFQDTQRTAGQNQELAYNINFYNMSRKEQLMKATKVLPQIAGLIEMGDPRNTKEMLILAPTSVIASVHQIMVVPAFQILATDEQCEKWLHKLKDFTAQGCYAQTELGHGSDVQNLQTQAEFDPQTNELVLHTPNIAATKFWPGDLGIFAHYALVYLQLIVKGKNYGVHPVWAQIRDDEHNPLPGVIVGDIGPKLGYQTKDNGYLAFNHYRVPVDNLLQRFIKISRDGQVTRTGDPKILYCSMMITRKGLCDSWPIFAGMSLTIAIRYSIRREQFKNDEGKQIKVIDYQLQKNKLLPLLAEYYAVVFGGQRISKLVDNLFEAVKLGDFSQMGLTHALLSGGKANYTQFVITCAEQCRLSCGGHGFAHYSGLPQIFFDQQPNVTLEGENQILNLQLARFMLKQLKNVHSRPQLLSNYFQFLQDEPDQSLLTKDFTSLEQLLMLLGWNCQILLQLAAIKLTPIKGYTMKETWDTKAGIMLHKAAISFIPYFNMKVFMEKIQTIQDLQIQHVLTRLARLYAISTLIDNMHGILSRNLLDSDQIKQLKLVKEILLLELRPNALPLIEAFGLQDSTLKSLIGGGDDDNIYEKLFKYASEQNTVNIDNEYIQRGLQHFKKLKDVRPGL